MEEDAQCGVEGHINILSQEECYSDYVESFSGVFVRLSKSCVPGKAKYTWLPAAGSKADFSALYSNIGTLKQLLDLCYIIPHLILFCHLKLWRNLDVKLYNSV